MSERAKEREKDELAFIFGSIPFVTNKREERI